MTGQQFADWIEDMKQAGLARSDADCAVLLGVNRNSIVNRKRDGVRLETALACRALLHRLKPYGEE